MVVKNIFENYLVSSFGGVRPPARNGVVCWGTRRLPTASDYTVDFDLRLVVFVAHVATSSASATRLAQRRQGGVGAPHNRVGIFATLGQIAVLHSQLQPRRRPSRWPRWRSRACGCAHAGVYHRRPPEAKGYGSLK